MSNRVILNGMKKYILIFLFSLFLFPVVSFAVNLNWFDNGSDTYTLGHVGVGTSTPAYNLHVFSTTDPAAITAEGVGTVGVNFIGRRANGSLGALSAVNASDNLFSLLGFGFGSTAYSASSRAKIGFYAAETWTNIVQGTYMSLELTPLGSNTKSEAFRVLGNGNFGVGTTSPSQKLSVAGNLYVSGNITCSGTCSGGTSTTTIVYSSSTQEQIILDTSQIMFNVLIVFFISFILSIWMFKQFML